MLIVLVAIGFFIKFAGHNFKEIPPLNWNVVSVAVIFLSVTLVVASTVLIGTIWHMLLRDNGVSLSWIQAQIIIAIAQFGKYLPGNIGQHVGRVALAREAGIPVPITLNAVLIEILWGTGIAASLALLSLILSVDSHALVGMNLQFSPLQLGAVIVLLLCVPWLGIGLLNRCPPELAKYLPGWRVIYAPRLRTALAVALLFLLCFVIMGLILKLQSHWLFSSNNGNLFELTCLFAVAWLAGYLIPGAPGGLGVREAMMVLLFSPILGSGTAVGLGVTLRVTTTMGDFVAFLLGLTSRKFYAKKNS